jgi:hypothetical protein
MGEIGLIPGMLTVTLMLVRSQYRSHKEGPEEIPGLLLF